MVTVKVKVADPLVEAVAVLIGAVVRVPFLPLTGKRWSGDTAQVAVCPVGMFCRVNMVLEVQIRSGPDTEGIGIVLVVPVPIVVGASQLL